MFPPARRRGRRRRWAFFLLAALVLVIWAEWGLSSVSQALTQEAARRHVTTAMNEAVTKELEHLDGDTAFVRITKDQSGKIISVQAETKTLNQLKTRLTEAVQKEINGKERVGVPAGSLTNVALLNGRGFSVPIRLQFTGSVAISFESEIETAGINQSCHRIVLHISVQAVSQSKRFSAAVAEETEVMIAETVIVGEVPKAVTGWK